VRAVLLRAALTCRREFEAQVKIQTLDRQLAEARRSLGELRRHGYRDEDDS